METIKNKYILQMNIISPLIFLKTKTIIKKEIGKNLIDNFRAYILPTWDFSNSFAILILSLFKVNVLGRIS